MHGETVERAYKERYATAASAVRRSRAEYFNVGMCAFRPNDAQNRTPQRAVLEFP